VRARHLRTDPAGAPLDTEEHLATLVLDADPEALADLRERALAPLADLRPATRERLAETLRSWLLHHGRREDVAQDLFVHAQTVRYRMGQLRELYGDRLDDPRTVLELTLALSAGTGFASSEE
jgi:DNA-binding PucR family transcriptional regulator